MSKISDSHIGDIVEVDWVDSKGSYVVWEFKDEYNDDIGYMKSVGYLISQDKEKIVIAQSISDDQYGKVFRIPFVSVRGISTSRSIISPNKTNIEEDK